eukprot:3021039-Rhodomonas_salina.1
MAYGATSRLQYPVLSAAYGALSAYGVPMRCAVLTYLAYQMPIRGLDGHKMHVDGPKHEQSTLNLRGLAFPVAIVRRAGGEGGRGKGEEILRE